MAQQIQRSIASDIHSSRMYSLIVDETTDLSVKEQVSICLRYVNDNFEVQDFLGFYETEGTDAAHIVKIIEDVLCRLSLPQSDCRGQCYDGASSMSDRLSGVQARIHEKCEKALYVHCCAHSLDLALQDASRSVSMIRDILDLVRDLNNVVRASAKRRGIFEKIRNELDNGELANSPHSPHSLRLLCPT